MPVADYVNYDYMRQYVADVMLYDAQRLVFSVDYDPFGGEEKLYTPAETFKCGLKIIRVSEQPSFTGTSEHIDARVRMPYDLYDLFQQRDRLRVSVEGDWVDYDVVGPISKSPFTVVLEVSRVQE